MAWTDKLWSGSITVAPDLEPGQSAWQQRAIAICSSRVFEWVVIAVIVLNAVGIGVQTYLDGDRAATHVLELLDWPIIIFFTAEIVIRFIAHGCSARRFGGNPWNIFDTIVVVTSLLPHVASTITILRAVRLLRIARLLRVMPDISVLMEGIRRAIGPAFSLGSIIALGTYIYAVLGYMLFAEAAPQYFGNIGLGMLTLFEYLTLEGWNETLHELMAVSPYALVYSLVFVICGTYVVLNFVVGVIITSLEDAYEAKRGVSEDDMMAVLKTMERKIDGLQSEITDLRGGVNDADERSDPPRTPRTPRSD